MALEAADDAGIGCERKALRSDRRASHMAAQRLEPLELVGGHEHLGMQGEAVAVGAQRSGQRWRAALAQVREDLANACIELGTPLADTRFTSDLRAATRSALLHWRRQDD